MKFKTFRFPSFKKFFNYQHDLNWEVSDYIGEFKATIRVTSCKSDYSQFDIVANIYNRRITNHEICYHSFFEYSVDTTSYEEFETWYKTTIKELNEAYIGYMTKIYLVED